MEDPVRFDIWVTVKPGSAAEAVAELLRLDLHLPEVEVRRRVSRSWREGAFIPLVGRVPWSEVHAVRAAPPAWAGDLRCYQEGYSPDLHPRATAPGMTCTSAGASGATFAPGSSWVLTVIPQVPR